MDEKIDNKYTTAIIGGLAVIGAAFITLYANEKLSDWSLYLGFIILSIQTGVILHVNTSLFERWTRYKKEQNENRLARNFFDEFKKDDYVGKFHLIQSKANGIDHPHRQETFHNVIDQLRHRNGFSDLPEPNIKSMKSHFYFWRDLYSRYYAYDAYDAYNFKLLLGDFSKIVNEYYTESVSTPLENIRRNSQRAKEKNAPPVEIEISLKEDWRQAVRYYDDFEKNYNDFVNRVNESFGYQVASAIFPARDLV